VYRSVQGFDFTGGVKFSIFPLGKWCRRYNSAALPRSLWLSILLGPIQKICNWVILSTAPKMWEPRASRYPRASSYRFATFGRREECSTLYVCNPTLTLTYMQKIKERKSCNIMCYNNIQIGAKFKIDKKSARIIQWFRKMSVRESVWHRKSAIYRGYIEYWLTITKFTESQLSVSLRSSSSKSRVLVPVQH